MHSEINAAIMFADLCGSTALYERLGDENAHLLVAGLMKSVDAIIEKHGGIVVKHIGDEVLALFSKLENAASCALQIHEVSTNEDSYSELRMKIGIRLGPVVIENMDVFGDTVNTSARLAEMATPGQTLVGAEISLIKGLATEIRSLGMHELKGKAELIEIFELLGPQACGLTIHLPNLSKFASQNRKLRIRSGESEIEIHNGQRIRIGRDTDTDFRIDHNLVSREHAVIEWVRDRFVLRDFSTNGLTVIENDGKQYFLHRDEITLIGQGRILLGVNTTSRDRVPTIYYETLEGSPP